MHTTNKPLAIKSAIWMLGTLTSFCLMAIGARELSGQMNTMQVLFIRGVIGLTVISIVIVGAQKTQLFNTQRIRLHTVRNLFHFGGQYGWFLGIGLLSLAEVTALEFTVPLWTVIIACIFLKESLTTPKVLALILGFLGVIIIAKPSAGVINTASLIVLGAAICYAVSHVSTKSLSSTEDPLSIVFFMCLIQLPIGLLFSLSHWKNPVGIQWLWLFVIGITALTAHYCMSKAMLYAEVSIVVTMEFLRLPLMAMIGVWLYSEKLELTLIAGALLMLAGNLLNIYTPNNSYKPKARS